MWEVSLKCLPWHKFFLICLLLRAPPSKEGSLHSQAASIPGGAACLGARAAGLVASPAPGSGPGPCKQVCALASKSRCQLGWVGAPARQFPWLLQEFGSPAGALCE